MLPEDIVEVMNACQVRETEFYKCANKLPD